SPGDDQPGGRLNQAPLDPFEKLRLTFGRIVLRPLANQQGLLRGLARRFFVLGTNVQDVSASKLGGKVGSEGIEQGNSRSEFSGGLHTARLSHLNVEKWARPFGERLHGVFGLPA